VLACDGDFARERRIRSPEVMSSEGKIIVSSYDLVDRLGCIFKVDGQLAAIMLEEPSSIAWQIVDTDEYTS